MNRDHFLRLVQSVKPRRVPQPQNRSAWPVGQGPRVWTQERIAQLAAQNELYRQAKRK